MSIKQEFNQECLSIITSRKKLQEPQLVSALIKVLNKKLSVKSSKYHQKIVLFSGYKRELCDILVIIKQKGQFRFSFIQNKNMTNNLRYAGLGKFKIDKGQHYLLTQFPSIFINGIKSDILKNHKFKTITTYSVFYKINGMLDFDLSAAVETQQTTKTKVLHNYQKLTYKNKEYLSYKNCDEIENNLDFGEIITKHDQQYYELAKIVSTFNVNKKELIEFFNDDNIKFYDLNNNIDYNDYHNLIVKNLLLVDMDKLER